MEGEASEALIAASEAQQEMKNKKNDKRVSCARFWGPSVVAGYSELRLFETWECWNSGIML